MIGFILLMGVCVTSLWAECYLATRFVIIFSVAIVSGLLALLGALLRAPTVTKTKTVFIFVSAINKRAILNMSWQCPVLGTEALAEEGSISPKAETST